MTSDARRATLVLVAVSLPLAVLSIDFTGVVVALPSIGEGLDVSTADLAWVVNAFALGFAGPLLVVGRVSDSVGHRTVLLVGLVVFAIGSLACGAAWTYPVLVAGRAVQGVGTACFMTASLAMVAAAFSGDARARAIGQWSAVGGTASAAGPLVAGAITVVVSWRGFFLVNLPLLAVAAVLTLRSTTAPASSGIGRGFDVRGGLLSATGLVLVVLGLVEASDSPLLSAPVVVPLVAGAASLVAFVAVERRAEHPLVPPALLRRPSFVRPVSAATLANVGFGVLELLVTLYLQDVRDWGPLETGVAFLAYSVPFAVVGGLMGRLGHRWSITALGAAGLAVIAVSFGLLALLPTAPMAAVLAALAVGGVGQGLVYSASSTAAMGAVSSEEEGEASAVLGVGRNLGISVGIALASIASLRATDLVEGAAILSVVLAVVTVLGAAALRREPA